MTQNPPKFGRGRASLVPRWQNVAPAGLGRLGGAKHSLPALQSLRYRSAVSVSMLKCLEMCHRRNPKIVSSLRWPIDKRTQWQTTKELMNARHGGDANCPPAKRGNDQLLRRASQKTSISMAKYSSTITIQNYFPNEHILQL